MNKKPVLLAACILFVVLFIPAVAYADSPVSPPSLDIQINSAPDGVAYYDLLVPKSMVGIKTGEINPRFLALHPGFAASALAKYDKFDCVSYTLYYQPADESSYLTYDSDFPQMTHTRLFQKSSQVSGKQPDIVSFYETGYNSIPTFMVAAVDAQGNILQVSPMVNAVHTTLRSDEGYIYDYSLNSISAVTWTNVFMICGILILLAGIRIGYSVGIEVLIAVPFKIRPLGLVALLNVFSGLVLTVGMFLFSIYGASYVLTLALFEVLAVLIEFVGLTKFAKGLPVGRVFGYLLVANAASLSFGLWVNTLPFLLF